MLWSAHWVLSSAIPTSETTSPESFGPNGSIKLLDIAFGIFVRLAANCEEIFLTIFVVAGLLGCGRITGKGPGAGL